MSGGKVRALEWRGSEGIWHKADAAFGGYYRITEYSGMRKPFKLETCGWWSVEAAGLYESLDGAKAAAQADYERRVLSALEPTKSEGGQEPAAYRYRYVDPVSGAPVWRYSDRLWNGQRPTESQPLYTRPAERTVTEADSLIDQLNVLCEDYGCEAGTNRLHWLHEQLAELAEARKALEPFVNEFEARRDAYIRRYPRHPAVGASNFDKMPDEWEMEDIKFTMGQFRAARRALNPEGREP